MKTSLINLFLRHKIKYFLFVKQFSSSYLQQKCLFFYKGFKLLSAIPKGEFETFKKFQFKNLKKLFFLTKLFVETTFNYQHTSR